MKFSTPCFVRVEDAEKRKELMEWISRIGYMVYCWCWDGCVRVIRCWTSPNGVSKAVGYPCKQVRKSDIDCGCNIELFMALAAMNQENDREQWFTNGHEWVKCPDDVVTKQVIPSYSDYHKATTSEIIKHFCKTSAAK